MTTKTPETYIATAELCRLVDLSDRQLRRHAAAGRIPRKTAAGWPLRGTLAGLVRHYRDAHSKEETPLRVEQTKLVRVRRELLESEAGRSGFTVDALQYVKGIDYENRECLWTLRRVLGALVAKAFAACNDARLCDAMQRLADDALAEYYKTFLAVRAEHIAQSLHIPVSVLQAELLKHDAPPATPTAGGPALDATATPPATPQGDA